MAVAILSKRLFPVLSTESAIILLGRSMKLLSKSINLGNPNQQFPVTPKAFMKERRILSKSVNKWKIANQNHSTQIKIKTKKPKDGQINNKTTIRFTLHPDSYKTNKEHCKLSMVNIFKQGEDLFGGNQESVYISNNKQIIVDRNIRERIFSARNYQAIGFDTHPHQFLSSEQKQLKKKKQSNQIRRETLTTLQNRIKGQNVRQLGICNKRINFKFSKKETKRKERRSIATASINSSRPNYMTANDRVPVRKNSLYLTPW